MRTTEATATGHCDRCGATWRFILATMTWLWTERSGALHSLKEYAALNEQGQPPPLRRCPCCKAKLTEAESQAT